MFRKILRKSFKSLFETLATFLNIIETHNTSCLSQTTCSFLLASIQRRIIKFVFIITRASDINRVILFSLIINPVTFKTC